MSRGWIYLYFQSKDEIFEALLDLQDAQYERYLEELIKSSSSIWEVVITLFSQQFQELLRSHNAGLMPAFYEYFLIGWRDETRHELLMKRYEKGIAQFARLLHIGVERGKFSPEMDIMDISRLAASYQEGIMTHSITVGTEKANTRMQVDALVEYLKSLLRTKSVKESYQREEIE